jgi:hypothetical protein
LPDILETYDLCFGYWVIKVAAYKQILKLADMFELAMVTSS